MALMVSSEKPVWTLFRFFLKIALVVMTMAKANNGIDKGIIVKRSTDKSTWAAGVKCAEPQQQEGNWGVETTCDDNLPVVAYNLKLEKDQGGSVDDSALNAVQFECMHTGQLISSTQGQWGEWKGSKKCPSATVITGVRMKSEGSGKMDNTAAVDMDVECTNLVGAVESKVLKGHGLLGRYSKWCDWFRCPTGQYICGLKTKVVPNLGSPADDTALNDVIFICCVPNDITIWDSL